MKLVAKSNFPTYAHGSASLIDIGQPGFRFLPFVVGGHRGLPPGGGLVFGPELMMLNILTGRFKLKTNEARMFALMSIAAAADPDRRLEYNRIILEYTYKNTKIRQALEELMREHFVVPFIEGYVEQGRAKGLEEGRRHGMAEGRRDGRAEGRVEASVSMLFAILAARSFTVLDQARALIGACTDPAQLETWASRAATAQTIDEVFA